MKNSKPLVIFLTALLVSGIGIWRITSTTIAAPNEIFTTITGQKIELSKLLGRPVIITFWATDCANCIKEIPHLINLHQRYHQKGLEIIAITMYYDIPNHVVEMTKAKQIPYHVALDLKATHAKAFGHVHLTPTTFLISPTGRITMQTTGVFDVKVMEQRLDHFLKG